MRHAVKTVVVWAVVFGVGVGAPAFGQTPPNVRLNTDSSPFLQNEEQIWIDLTDSLNVVAVWRDFRLGFRRVAVGVSHDGGVTWRDSLLSGLRDRQTDPCVIGDRNGAFYVTTMDFSSAGAGGGLSVWRSSDGGDSWFGPVSAVTTSAYLEDKEFTAVDRTGGSFDGNFYMAWARVPLDGSPVTMEFVRSTDSAKTFSPAMTLGPPVVNGCGTLGAGEFAIPVVSSNGWLHVFWQGEELDQGTCAHSWVMRHVVSTDGGVTFTPAATLWAHDLGWEPIDGGIDVYGSPMADADISGGVYDGSIYIAQTYREPGTDEVDVIVRRSTDNAVSWSDPAVVNDDRGGMGIDQFHPWLSVNEDGTLVVVFYDQRNDPLNHYLFDCYFSASYDGGETFIRNYRLSSVSSTPDNLGALVESVLGGGNSNGGDTPVRSPLAPTAGRLAEYIAVHARHNHAVAAWTDTRDGTQDVYSAQFTIPFLAPRLYYPADSTAIKGVDTSFSWATCWHESEDAYRLEVSTDPGFGTIDFVFDGLTDNGFRPSPSLPVGDYYWRVKAFRAAGDSTGYSEIYTLKLGCTDGAAPAVVAPNTGDTLATLSVLLDWADEADAVGYAVQVSSFADYSLPVVDTQVTVSELTVAVSDSTQYYWRVNSTNLCGTGIWTESNFRVTLCPVVMTGDVNLTATLTSADIIYLVTYVFKGGPEPQPIAEAGDVNCDGTVTSADIIYLVGHVFKGGPAPCDVCSIL